MIRNNKGYNIAFKAHTNRKELCETNQDVKKSTESETMKKSENENEAISQSNEI